METHQLLVPPDHEPERLDVFITRALPVLTRSAVLRLIDSGLVQVGTATAKASLRLKGGERVTVRIPPPAAARAEAETIPLDILYEDTDLVVVNKAAGMTVHPGAGTSGGTLVNALLAHCRDLSGIGGELRPGIVHRIDKDTSGVLVVAKNDPTHQSLARQFKEHTVKRVYLALVFGSPRDDRGTIESTIGRHPVHRQRMSSQAPRGRRAITRWRVLRRYPGLTLLELRLETGRTHQIRVHLSEQGYPLVGDPVYGGTGRLAGIRDARLRSQLAGLHRQALHAAALGFIHPGSGQYLDFTTPLPDDLQRIVDQLEAHAAPAE
jgi:23S rRNA pseudouridine1911/1915/1917 synthase